jgi:two-component system, cell cycle sensor histidine kinase and response regulator CckA
MTTPLWVLMVEDSENDALLVADELRRAGFDPVFERVESAEAMGAALAREEWEIVVADYALPRFDGLGAIRLVQESGRDLPVIIVSGAIGEEMAVRAMKAGAHDYVMKDRLARLGPAVQRELREAEDRRERRRAEAALQFTQFSVDHAAEAIFWILPDGHVFNANNAASDMLGYAAAELRSMAVQDIDPASASGFWHTHWIELRKDISMTFESRHRARDGRLIPVEIRANLLVADGREYAIWFVRDISERKQMAAKLRMAERLELIGQLVLGVAHEVRNPLNCIMAVAEALQEDLDNKPEFKPHIDHIREQVDRLARLVSDLLDMGKPVDPSRMHRDSLPAIVSSALALWKEAQAERAPPVTFKAPPFDEALDIMADGARLQQVLINVLDNAVQNSRGGTEIKVEIAVRDEWLKVLITDGGSGIPPGNLTKVFEPFFTTRKRGTGLGLCIVQRVVRDHGGEVEIRNNQPPPGCTVEVRLPRVG